METLFFCEDPEVSGQHQRFNVSGTGGFWKTKIVAAKNSLPQF